MSGASNFVIDIDPGARAGAVPCKDEIRRWVRLALAGAGEAGSRSIAVKLVDVEEMQELNRRYRGLDKPTNVLSFGAPPAGELPGEEPGFLGDIAICAAVVRDEAAQQGKPPEAHWAHVLVHGTLHLLGFDHVDDDDARKMEELEIRILGEAGIKDPYLA